MKNSLFKRAFATVAAVPLALSQCLTCASYAVTNDSAQSTTENTDSSEKESYTLKDNLLYIAPDQIESTWYSAFNAELISVGNLNPNGYISKDTIVNAILNHAGKYESTAETLLGILGDEDVKYTISSTGDITITGKIANFDAGEIMNELSAKYKSSILADADFSSVDCSGTYEIILECSDLSNGSTFDVKAKYIANTPVNGKTVFAVGEMADFISAKLSEIQSVAYSYIDNAGLSDENVVNAKADVNKSCAKYANWISKIKNNQDKVNTIERKISSPDMKSLIESMNNYIENNKYANKVEDKLDKDLTIPETFADIMNNSFVVPIYEAVIEQINAKSVHYDMQISRDDIASFADNDLYNLTATASAGTYTLTGDFPDDEVVDSVKHMVATFEVGDIYSADGNLATVGFRIYRDPVTTTTTTTTTSGTDTDTDTTTTTTTSGTDTDTDTTTTTTTSGTDTDTDTTTTTTTSGTDTDTDTTTTTTSGTDTDTDTTTTTTTSGTDTDTDTTTTTTTSGTDTDTDTTTTTTTSGTDTDTDTTTTTTSGSDINLDGVIKSWSVSVETSGYGFYYSHEKEFNKAQIGSLILHVVYETDETDDIEIDFTFASTPSETFVKGDDDFKYIVGINYAGGTITDANGTIILAEGDALKDIDGNDAGVEVYIGYMGDVNLDYNINSIDASQVLGFYAATSTGKLPNETILSESNLITDADSVYDHFAAFLGDVKNNLGDNNYNALKADRILDSVDASNILSCYAYLSTGSGEIGTQEIWDKVFED